MAPRRGGGGGIYSSSGGGGGSRCDYCTVQYTLYGSNWKNSTRTALFVFTCFAAAVLAACLILPAFFKWLRPQGGRAGGRTAIYFFAALTTFLALLIRLVDTGLSEEQTDVTYLYNIIYIFLSLFTRIGELLILAVIFRTVYVFVRSATPTYAPNGVVPNGGNVASSSTTSPMAKAVSVVQIVMIILLAIITTIAFGYTTAAYAYLMIDGPYFDSKYFKRARDSARVQTAYEVLYLISAVFLLIMTVMSAKRAAASSKAKMLLFIVLGALVFQSFWTFLDNLAVTYADTTKSVIDFDWAVNYFVIFTIPIIFLGLALYACLDPIRHHSGAAVAGTGPGHLAHNGAAGTAAASTQPGMTYATNDKELGHNAVATGAPAHHHSPRLNQYGGIDEPNSVMAQRNGGGLANVGPQGAGWKGKYWHGYAGPRV